MSAGRIAWGAVLLVAGALEAYGVANPGKDDTLSEFTRWAFQVDHPAGRLIFIAVWLGFSGWFLRHIVAGAAKSSAQALLGARDEPTHPDTPEEP